MVDLLGQAGLVEDNYKAQILLATLAVALAREIDGAKNVFGIAVAVVIVI